jgi:hypothetical protein
LIAAQFLQFFAARRRSQRDAPVVEVDGLSNARSKTLFAGLVIDKPRGQCQRYAVGIADPIAATEAVVAK